MLACLAGPQIDVGAASSHGKPKSTPVCGTSQPGQNVHRPKSASDAFMQHGVHGTVLEEAGDTMAVDVPGGTIATVDVPGGKLVAQPGQTVDVSGHLDGGIVVADKVTVTGGKAWKAPTTPTQPSGQIRHVIFIIQENHSFDNYFGTYPGVIGYAPGVKIPLHKDGPANVAPFELTKPIPRDLDHSWDAAHVAFDHGRMDGFAYADSAKDVMGYYTGAMIPNYWAYAHQFTLDDMFFSSLMGPSLPNHLYTVAGQAGGWLWNAYLPPYCGFQFGSVPAELTAGGVSWKYYSGMNPQRFWLWTPLPGFTQFQKSAILRQELVWNAQYFTDLRYGGLPDVSWITPSMVDSEHPPTDPRVGMWYVTDLLNALMQSPYWSDTLVVVTWDEYGGFYDGVRPSQVDPFGFGFRVPALIISPYARHASVNPTPYDFTSVLRYIEDMHNLPRITNRIAMANSIASQLDLSQKPQPPFLITAPLPASSIPNAVPPPAVPDHASTGTTATAPTTAGVSLSLSLSGLIP